MDPKPPTPEEIPQPASTNSYSYPDTVPVSYQYELAVLNEECSEVGQAVSKILRFGWDSQHPDTEVVNDDQLYTELGDVQAAIEFGIQRGALDKTKIANAKKAKLETYKKVAPPVMMANDSKLPKPHLDPKHEGVYAVVVIGVIALIATACILMGSHFGEKKAKAQNELMASRAALQCYAHAVEVNNKNAEPGNTNPVTFDTTQCDVLQKLAGTKAKKAK